MIIITLIAMLKHSILGTHLGSTDGHLQVSMPEPFAQIMQAPTECCKNRGCFLGINGHYPLVN